MVMVGVVGEVGDSRNNSDIRTNFDSRVVLIMEV